MSEPTDSELDDMEDRRAQNMIDDYLEQQSQLNRAANLIGVEFIVNEDGFLEATPVTDDDTE